MNLVIGLVVVLLALALPMLDRLTDAPVMRQDVNAGTRWWRLRERLRRREEPGWPSGLAEEGASELDDLAAWRSRRRPRSRPWRN